MKQKLWPPVPDLHRALGSFLLESSKHGQVRRPRPSSPRRIPPPARPGAARRAAPNPPPLCPPQTNAFYKQPPEEAVPPCLLEVLPGPRREPAAPPPPEHAAGRLPSTDIANQSYLLMSGWEPRGPAPP